MLRLPWQKTKRAVGIDFGSSGTQIVSLQSRDKIYQVDHIAILPPQSELTKATLKQALQVINPAAKSVVLAVPNASVISKTLAFAAAFTEDELAMQVRLEAQQLLPEANVALAVDFTILGPHKSNPQLQEILLMACREEEIFKQISFMKNIGSKVSIIDVEVFALARAYFSSIQYPSQATVALIDLNPHKIAIIVLKEQQIIYKREERIIETSLNLQKLTEQIQALLQFFIALQGPVVLQKLILSGIAAHTPDLPKILKSYLNLPVQLADPFTQMKISEQIDPELLMKTAPSLCVAAGLALRGLA